MPVAVYADLLPGWPEAEARAAEGGGVTLLRPGDPSWTVVSTPGQVRRAAAAGRKLRLRGLESGGPVEPFTVLVLIREAARTGAPWIAEGLGVRAMAASLAVGAAGILLDAHLWGLPTAPLPEDLRRALAGRPSGRDTAVVGELQDRRERLLRGAAPAPQCIGEAARWGGSGSLVAAITAIRVAVEAHLAIARRSTILRDDPLGTGVPVVQGPMANVAERPNLARAVSRAGGMPFFALGALDPARAEAVLREAAGNVPGRWGAGVIGFDVAPFRDAHLALLAEMAGGTPAATGRLAVTLAGGTPELALRLSEQGLEPWLHTPSGRLARRALDQGVGTVILEGHEAGGHVGALTSVGLWEEGLEAVEGALSGGPAPRIILAGGIGDAVSAAFAAAMAAPAHARGAQVALQAGTAFFFTHEIVEGGQLTPTCQSVALECDRTVLVGTTANLPLRVAPNAWAAAAREDEARLEADGVPLDERRAALERANVGRTRMAAKGIERNPAHAEDPSAPRYREVPPSRQLAEGAFTLGQGAAVTREIVAVADVVRALSADADALLTGSGSRNRPWGAVTPVAGDPSVHRAPIAAPVSLGRRSSRPAADAPIAIVGLGCVLPQAFDVPSYWENLVRGVDAVAPVPDERWSVERYWDPQAGPRGPARSRSRLAGAVRGFEFDPLRFRIPPRVAATMDPAQKLALHATAEAVDGLELDGERTAVVLGNAMGGEYGKSLALRVRWREALVPLRSGALAHLSDAEWAELEREVEADVERRLPPLNSNSMAGALANVIAGRVAQWLDAYGGNFTVDAACASSLAALSIAVDWLRNGRADAVVTGGVDTDLSPETFVGFTLTGALSSAGSRPFARGADGFVMGEGCGILVVERLDDAVRLGHPVWAVIRGVGQSSDGRGRGITAPKAEGQRLALRRALDEAGVDVASLGLVEAHGTGTTIGDRTETAVLREAFAGADGVWLGSVKSMLGHLKGAAGAAGALKAVLSVATGVVPPTLHAGPVEPELGLAGGPFRLPRAPVALHGSPRRAGVSAFGFGGTNFHVVLEQPPDHVRSPPQLPALEAFARPLVLTGSEAEWPIEASAPERALVLAWGAADPDALARAVESGEPMPPGAVAAAPHRIVVVTSAEDRERAVVRALRSLRDGAAAPDVFRGHGEPRPAVLLVPGQGALRPGSVASLRRLHPTALDAVEAALADHTDLDLDALEALATTDVHALHLVMLALAAGWGRVLADAGVPVAATVGHSLGEYGALVLAGRMTLEDALRAVSARGAALQACPPGEMLAVALPAAEIEPLAAAHGLSVAAINGPRAVVLSGPSVASAREELVARGVPAVDVPVVRAFHSPAVASARAPLRAALGRARPGKVVVSSRTGRPFGEDVAEELVEALVDPVRFHEAATAALAYGEPVEIGPGRALGRHVPGCMTLDPDPGDPTAIVRAAAALLARGHPGLLVAAGFPLVAAGFQPAAAAARKKPAPGWKPGATKGAPGATKGAPAAARTPGSPEREAAREAVVAAIAEVTGYPPDVLQDGADLEGELGIDSIRRMEILGVLQERLGFATDERDYAKLARADLDGLVSYVLGARPAEAPAEAAGSRAYVTIRRPLPPPSAKAERVAVWRPVPRGDTVPERVRSAVLEALDAARRIDREATDALAVITSPDPATRAVAALARCVGLEKSLAVREIRVEGGADAEAEALAAGRPPRVVLTPGGAFAEELLPWLPPEASLPDRPVVVASGGASGIVMAALKGLGARVLLMGRRPEADVTALGSDARYVSSDVRDPEAVARAVAVAREAWGRIDVVLHGAGVLADAPVEKLGPDEVDAVLDPKLGGAAALMAATAEDRPALWVVFSSLAAWTGNPGQAAYAAANAALDAWEHPTAARSLSIGWTAWEAGMAAGRERALRGRGVVPLPVEVGAAAFRDLLGASGRVLVGPDPADATLRASAPWPLDVAAGFQPAARLRLGPDDPALADHRVGGKPLVPAAFWVRAIAAAVGLSDGAGAVQLDRFVVLAPTFVERPRRDVRIEAIPDGDGWDVRILAGDTPVATARARRVPSPAPEAAPAPLAHPTPAAPLYRDDLWFHGPAWRVITALEGDGNGLARADTHPAGADPIAAAVDAAHQLISAWSGHETGWLAVPVSADRWLVAGEPEGNVRIEARSWVPAVAPGVPPGEIHADVLAVDERGRVVLRGEGVRLRRASRWPEGVADPLRRPSDG